MNLYDAMNSQMIIRHVLDVPALEDDNVRLTLDAVFAEIKRQDALARRGKFGGTHILPSGPNHARLAVLMEEVGEVAHELNEALSSERLDGSYPSKDNLVTELIQVAACAVAWASALETP